MAGDGDEGQKTWNTLEDSRRRLYIMSNKKVQMSNQGQNPNFKIGHLSIWSSFYIGILTF